MNTSENTTTLSIFPHSPSACSCHSRHPGVPQPTLKLLIARGFCLLTCHLQPATSFIHPLLRPSLLKTSLVLICTFLPFSPQPSTGFEISLCKFHKNRLSERLLEGKAVTLLDELREHKAVFQKAYFQFLS